MNGDHKTIYNRLNRIEIQIQILFLLVGTDLVTQLFV